jgi:hypothetical protein
MIMKRYSIFHLPVLTFFSKDLYADIGRNWKGVNFLYLLLLLAVCWVGAMVKMHRNLNNFVINDAPPLIDQVPEITITDGQVSIKEDQPYYINSPDTGQVLIIIDTTGKIESLEETEASCLLTKNKLITKKNDLQNDTYDLSRVRSLSVTSEQITSWSKLAAKFAAPVMYPFALIGSYVYRIVQVLIYAAVGMLMASICKTKLSYAALIRLAVAAITPGIIVYTILALAGTPIRLYWYLIAALGYLFFAVKSVSSQQAQPADIQPQPTDQLDSNSPDQSPSGY